MSYYYLEITRGVELGRRYALSDGALSIGRSSGNTITLHPSERSVSGHHAILYKTSSRIMIQDLQSTNGTYVNDEKVTERDLQTGDTIGLGARGPRLKLVQSESELALVSAPGAEASPAIPKGDTRARTVEDDRRSMSRLGALTGRVTRAEESAMIEIPPTEHVPLASSMTMELERKIMERRAGAGDMHALLKSGDRVAKIVGRGNVGETQAGLILGAYHASRKMRAQLYVILAAVVMAAMALIIFFAGRAWQYKRLIDRGQALEKKLDLYDRMIAEAKAGPNADRERIASLVEELEKAGIELASVRGNLRETDVRTLYEDPVEERIAEILSRFGESNYHVPVEMVERVKHHIGEYTGPLKPVIGRYLKRRAIYSPMIRSVLAANNLPYELSYVAMLESGFNPNALSHAGARGMWQFMEATGRRYGLRIDSEVDERIVPEKATKAAAEYFKDLISIFGGKSSLMLAMAAYNAGEGRVQGALRKIEDPLRNRDFWYIYRMGYLAEETNEYIPRVFALMIISEHAAAYGFADIDTIGSGAGGLEAENDFVEFGLGADYE